jgi:hypothetical protein
MLYLQSTRSSFGESPCSDRPLSRLPVRKPSVQVVMKRYPILLDHEPACWYPSRCSNRINGRRSRWHVAVSQRKFMALLEGLDTEINGRIRTIHLVCNTVSTPHGKELHKWITNLPCVVLHVRPVHGSWMNQVEPWFSISPRRCWRLIAFASKDHLRVQSSSC